jgi:ribonuclease HI
LHTFKPLKSVKKYYVVWKGRVPGVYSDWVSCKQQVEGFTGAAYKAFTSMAEAKQAYEGGSGSSAVSSVPTARQGSSNLQNVGGTSRQPIPKSICVDASCLGNPGLMEYRGVNTISKQEIFRIGPLEDGTNNIGEFLAIVHALAVLYMEKDTRPIYSDSVNAMLWVRNKKCKTKLALTRRNQAIFDLIDRAEKWLAAHTYTNPILKWETDRWGENPADFGRK